MGAAVRIRNRIGKGQNLVVIAVVVLQNNIDKNFITLTRDYNWLRMNDLFVLAELLDEFFDPVLVEKSFFFWRLVALVGQGDFETWIEKCELAQSGGKPLKLELGRDREDCGVGQERDQSASRLFVF